MLHSVLLLCLLTATLTNGAALRCDCSLSCYFYRATAIISLLLRVVTPLPLALAVVALVVAVNVVVTVVGVSVAGVSVVDDNKMLLIKSILI